MTIIISSSSFSNTLQKIFITLIFSHLLLSSSSSWFHNNNNNNNNIVTGGGVNAVESPSTTTSSPSYIYGDYYIPTDLDLDSNESSTSPSSTSASFTGAPTSTTTGTTGSTTNPSSTGFTTSAPSPTPSPKPSSLYPFPNPNNYSLVTSTMVWGGALPICETCNISGGTYTNSFACGPTPQRGDWNDGVNYFDFPFPSEQVIVQQVAFVLNGAFNCDVTSQNLSIVFLVEEVEINTQPIVISENDFCDCGNCAHNVTVAPFVSDANVTLNTTGPNKFRLFVEDNTMCLSSIDIYFYYTLPSPTPTSPPTGNKNPLTTTQWIIIASSITGGLLIAILLFVFIKKRMRKIGYTQLKEGKNIDIAEIKLGERIGKGNFGEVYKGYWRGVIVAIKKLPIHNINENVLKEFHREIELMKNLRHPNVIQYLGSCTIPPNICICTEFMTRGSLYNILHDASIPLPWSLIKNMCIDAAKGIIYLHNSNPVIFHRDLKSHNLLVDDSWKVKVADFGLSTIEQANTMTACGTPSWSSPEVIRNQRYTSKADVYSFGIVLWECATRQDPYSGMPPFQVIFAVGREGLRPPIPRSSPPDFVQLMIDCWNENPDARPSMETVLLRLESIDINGWPDIIFKQNNTNTSINK